MKILPRFRYILLELVGVAALLAKSWFKNSIGTLGHSYLGNLGASFAVYNLVAFAASPWLNRFWIAVISLSIVELFELTNGFGVMTNVYDPFDYLANLLGIALAFLVDFVLSRLIRRRKSILQERNSS
jgi:putative flippase GtrA